MNNKEDAFGEVQITREGIIPPPPSNTFKPTFMKGKNEVVLASDCGLKNEHIAKSLLDGITLEEDLKLYQSVATPRMLAR